MFVGPALGIFVGSLMPWLEPERLGPFMPGAYLFSFAAVILPNILFIGVGTYLLRKAVLS